MRYIFDARDVEKEQLLQALEYGYTHIFLKESQVHEVSQLARLTLYTETMYPMCVVATKQEELDAVDRAKKHGVVILSADTPIIALENILAQNVRVWLLLSDATQCSLAENIMEYGVEAVIVPKTCYKDVPLHDTAIQYSLETSTVLSVADGGIADRVCIDTTSLFTHGEGLLIGNTSAMFCLVHAETEHNTYVNARPFRVNAGSVHSYCMGSDRTYYLSEIIAGTRLLACDAHGNTREVVVGRVKIERRPLLLVTFENTSGIHSIFLQNAETIHLVTPDGNPKSVVALKKGDTILTHGEKSGRHFGIHVEETILER